MHSRIRKFSKMSASRALCLTSAFVDFTFNYLSIFWGGWGWGGEVTYCQSSRIIQSQVAAIL